MISKVLLIVSIILTLVIYGRLFILYLSSQNKKYNYTGQEIALKMIKDENSISLIKNKESFFSKYNLKRNVVKLSKRTYDGSDYFSQSVSAFLSGYAMSKSKYLGLLSNIFKELKVISLSPIVAIIISSITNNSMDAKLGIIILILVALYQYILNIINVQAIEKVRVSSKEIINIINIFNKANTIFFISSLIQIMRLVVIIINI